MTRQKKSRGTAVNGQRHLPASEIRKTREHKEETKKKGAGLKSGNRNSLQQQPADNHAHSNNKKDPRLGSTKPIALLPEVVTETLKPEVNFIPKVSLQKVKVEAVSPEQELADIEQDQRLQQLLERVEQDEILTGKDAKYFNAKTARMEQLMADLGLLAEEEPADMLDPMAAFERTDWRKDILGDEDNT